MSSKSQAKGRMKKLLMYFPHLVGLCGRLLMDERVSKTEKALFTSALVYAIAPLDFLPDFLPFLGQIDDAYLVSLTLMRLVNRTDAEIVREHWRGQGDVVELAGSIANLAPILLPNRISRVISANIDFAPLVQRGKLIWNGKTKALKIDDDADEDQHKVALRIVESK